MKHYVIIWMALAVACALIWWGMLVWIGWPVFVIIPAIGFIVHYFANKE